MKRLFFAALALAPLPAAAQAGTELVTIEVKEGGPEGCRYRAEGRRMSAEQLERRARTWASQRRDVEVHGTRNTPYRCVGGLIFMMQGAGIEKVTFIGHPIGPSAVLYVAKDCRLVANGEVVTLDGLRAQAPEWSRSGLLLQLEVDPDADYRCVDSVLAVIKESNVTKLGFVGNEQAPAQ